MRRFWIVLNFLRTVMMVALFLITELPSATATSPTPPPTCIPETIEPLAPYVDRSAFPRVFSDVKIERIERMWAVDDLTRFASRVEGRYRAIIPDEIIAREFAIRPQWECLMVLSFRNGDDPEPWKALVLLRYHNDQADYAISPERIRAAIQELENTDYGQGVGVSPISRFVYAGNENNFTFDWCLIEIDDTYPIQYKEWSVPVNNVLGVVDRMWREAERLNTDSLVMDIVHSLAIPSGTPFTGEHARGWKIRGARSSTEVNYGAVCNRLVVDVYDNYDSLAVLPLMSEVLACPAIEELRQSELLVNMTYRLNADNSAAVEVNHWGISVNTIEQTAARFEVDPVSQIITYTPTGCRNTRPGMRYPFVEPLLDRGTDTVSLTQ